MNEFEMVTLFLDFYNHALAYFELFIASLSAVLIVGYLVGPKLTKTMVAVIIGLFTMVTVVCMWHTIGAYSDGTAMAQEIAKAQALPDSKLKWMFQGNPPENLNYFAPILSGIIIIAYVGAIVFFFHARNLTKPDITE